MLLLVRTAWADAIMPGPAICPPGMSHTIRDHAEVCAFDPMTAVVQGGVLLGLTVVVLLVVAATRKG